MVAIRCTPEQVGYYTHHLSLEDGQGNKLGFMVVDSKGQPNIRGLRNVPYPRNTLQTTGATGRLSEQRQPYGEFSRTDWSGGLGIEDGEEDSTRYYFGKRVWSLAPGKMMLAPKLYRSYQPGVANEPSISNDSIVYQPLTGSQLYYATSFQWSGAGTRTLYGLTVLGEIISGSGKFQVDIYSDSAGSPGSKLYGALSSQFEVGRKRYYFDFGGIVLSEGVTYWLVVYPTTTDEILFYAGTLGDTAHTVKVSANKTTWNTSSNKPVVYQMMVAAPTKDRGFFVYKWGMYLWQEDGTVMIAGDRGEADSNSGNLSKLNDATKSWVTNIFAGALVGIYDGPGTMEWRRVTGNGSNYLDVSPAWETTHTTSTLYVIVASNYFQALTSGMTHIEDAAVAESNEIVYFARGDTTALRRMIWTAAGGHQFDDDTAASGASFLISAHDQEKGPVMWRAVNAGVGAIQMAACTAWGTNLTWESEIRVGGLEMDITGLIKHDGYIYVMKSDSVWAIKDGKAEKLELGELLTMSLDNGRRPTILPPYLIFPYGDGVERMYNGLVEDFGPEINDGYPPRYNGPVRDTQFIPGGIIALKSAGDFQDTYRSQGQSGAYIYRAGGWHPLAHIPEGIRGHALGMQRNADGRDYLYLAGGHGAYMMRFPRQWDYRKDPYFYNDLDVGSSYGNLEDDGYFVSGWFQAGNVNHDKRWRRMTIHGENLAAPSIKIMVYYQVDYGQVSKLDAAYSEWTYAGETGTYGYRHEIDLNFNGRRVRFMFRLIGNGTISPVLTGYNVEYLSRIDSAESFSYNFRLGDVTYEWMGGGDHTLTEADALLKAWRRSVEPLTLRCIFAPFDNYQVIIEPGGLQPESLDKSRPDSNMIASITLLEVV